MTHTLHRSGNRESLKRDYVWLMYQTKGINDEHIVPKAKVFIEAAEACNCVNWGDVKSGNVLEMSTEEIKARLTDQSRLRGVFTSKADVVEFVKRIKAADLGISVVISGLLDEIEDVCAQANVEPHTINYSLGVWGNQNALPSDDILSITTMCGHHMIAPGIVEQMLDDIVKNCIAPEEAARRLGRLCPCGIFNHIRAAEELQKMVVSRRAATLSSCGDS